MRLQVIFNQLDELTYLYSNKFQLWGMIQSEGGLKQTKYVFSATYEKMNAPISIFVQF